MGMKTPSKPAGRTAAGPAVGVADPFAAIGPPLADVGEAPDVEEVDLGADAAPDLDELFGAGFTDGERETTGPPPFEEDPVTGGSGDFAERAAGVSADVLTKFVDFGVSRLCAAMSGESPGRYRMDSQEREMFSDAADAYLQTVDVHVSPGAMFAMVSVMIFAPKLYDAGDAYAKRKTAAARVRAANPGAGVGFKMPPPQRAREPKRDVRIDVSDGTVKVVPRPPAPRYNEPPAGGEADARPAPRPVRTDADGRLDAEAKAKAGAEVAERAAVDKNGKPAEVAGVDHERARMKAADRREEKNAKRRKGGRARTAYSNKPEKIDEAARMVVERDPLVDLGGRTSFQLSLHDGTYLYDVYGNYLPTDKRTERAPQIIQDLWREGYRSKDIRAVIREARRQNGDIAGANAIPV